MISKNQLEKQIIKYLNDIEYGYSKPKNLEKSKDSYDKVLDLGWSKIFFRI